MKKAVVFMLVALVAAASAFAAAADPIEMKVLILPKF